MERHADDPRNAPLGDDPWREAADRWSSLGERLRDHYRRISSEAGPSETEVRQALATLGSAVEAVAGSVGAALRDPDLRHQVKDAAASFVTALGRSFADLGEELRRARSAEGDQPTA